MKIEHLDFFTFDGYYGNPNIPSCLYEQNFQSIYEIAVKCNSMLKKSNGEFASCICFCDNSRYLMVYLSHYSVHYFSSFINS